MNLLADATAIATLCLVGATIALVWVGWLQRGWMRKHAEHLEVLAAQTREIALAARDSADAATKAIGSAERARFELNVRVVAIASDLFQVTVAFRNRGNSVAHVTRVLGHWEAAGAQMRAGNFTNWGYQSEERPQNVAPGAEYAYELPNMGGRLNQPAWGYFGIEYTDGQTDVPRVLRRSFVTNTHTMTDPASWLVKPVSGWDCDT